jgi:glycerol uptake facilitator-like aquaporin
MFTDTFAGIAPSSAPGFIGMQVLGAAVAVAIVLALYPGAGDRADDVVVPHAIPDANTHRPSVPATH